MRLVVDGDGLHRGAEDIGEQDELLPPFVGELAAQRWQPFRPKRLVVPDEGPRLWAEDPALRRSDGGSAQHGQRRRRPAVAALIAGPGAVPVEAIGTAHPVRQPVTFDPLTDVGRRVGSDLSARESRAGLAPKEGR